jgi:acetyl-CoA acetyltransferase
MTFQNTFIPYGAYWSTPFCRWQESLAGFHSVKLAATCATSFLERSSIAPESFDGIALGITVPQRHVFYGAPWLSAMLGAPGITGPTISQACATSGRVAVSAALEIEAGVRECILTVACDRTSNGPHVYYPAPGNPGGTGEAENPVMDNFGFDPYAKLAMIQTAENVAARAGIGREEQDAATLIRNEQYGDALADDGAFHRRFMLPVELKRGKKVLGTVEADEGIFPTTAEGLARLRPVVEGGTVTFGSQTHPADGNAGMVFCTKERAAALSRDDSVTVQLLSFGEARVEKGYMPIAVVPAAQQALDRAGLKFEDCEAIKTHNPFAVNDVYFARETGVALEDFNRFGSTLIWGHPQAPMGCRALIELIEELALRGGGHGLYSGCAAGDTAMALVVRVDA